MTIIIFLYEIDGEDIDPQIARAVITSNWTDIIGSLKDPISFANELKEAKLITDPVHDTAVDRFSGRTATERVTALLASVETAVKIKGNRFKTLCEIVGHVGDSTVATKLISAYQEKKKVDTK